MTISKKRQEALRNDAAVVRLLHKKAIERWGEDAVSRDLTRLWDLRCIWGMSKQLPFGTTEFKNLAEMLWIAKEVCGFVQATPRKAQAGER